jgi:hypothetical protein
MTWCARSRLSDPCAHDQSAISMPRMRARLAHVRTSGFSPCSWSGGGRHRACGREAQGVLEGGTGRVGVESVTISTYHTDTSLEGRSKRKKADQELAIQAESVTINTYNTKDTQTATMTGTFVACDWSPRSQLETRVTKITDKTLIQPGQIVGHAASSIVHEAKLRTFRTNTQDDQTVTLGPERLHISNIGMISLLDAALTIHTRTVGNLQGIRQYLRQRRRKVDSNC